MSHTRRIIAPHSWVADHEAPVMHDAWPARSGTMAMKCEGCPARGHRRYTMVDSKYDGFHQLDMPLYQEVMRTSGQDSCPGYDLMVEKHANWLVVGLGYAGWFAVGIFTLYALRPGSSYFAELWRAWQRYQGVLFADILTWLPVIVGAVVAYIGWALVSHGRAELRRVNGELEIMRHRPSFGFVAFKRESTPGSDVPRKDDAPRATVHLSRRQVTFCQADDDGDCMWAKCPQHRDREPLASGRHCPLDNPELTKAAVDRILAAVKQPD